MPAVLPARTQPPGSDRSSLPREDRFARIRDAVRDAVVRQPELIGALLAALDRSSARIEAEIEQLVVEVIAGLERDAAFGVRDDVHAVFVEAGVVAELCARIIEPARAEFSFGRIALRERAFLAGPGRGVRCRRFFGLHARARREQDGGDRDRKFVAALFHGGHRVSDEPEGWFDPCTCEWQFMQFPSASAVAGEALPGRPEGP